MFKNQKIAHLWIWFLAFCAYPIVASLTFLQAFLYAGMIEQIFLRYLVILVVALVHLLPAAFILRKLWQKLNLYLSSFDQSQKNFHLLLWFLSLGIYSFSALWPIGSIYYIWGSYLEFFGKASVYSSILALFAVWVVAMPASFIFYKLSQALDLHTKHLGRVIASILVLLGLSSLIMIVLIASGVLNLSGGWLWISGTAVPVSRSAKFLGVFCASITPAFLAIHLYQWATNKRNLNDNP